MSPRPNDTAEPDGTEEPTGRYIRRSREEVARLAEGRKPFDYDEWVRTEPPATPEELAETEEFLRQRNAEREAARAAQRRIYLDGSADAEPAGQSEPVAFADGSAVSGPGS